MRFLHIADLHLGCRRYNLDERTKDFFRAWHDIIVRHILPSKVDFVLIAGDFFNSRRADPQTMNHAIVGLEKLKQVGIPVLVIEGNHDQRDPLTEHSWLRSLSGWGYLKLLEPVGYTEGRPHLIPWDEEAKAGSYIDIADARIFGSHWYGMTANQMIPLLAEAVKTARDPDRFNILMLHTDVEGQLNRPLPALSIAKLKELRAAADYVALGHTHKRFELENWAFNPGSPEAVTIDEYREDRGANLVEVERDGENWKIEARYITDYFQRPIQRLSYDVSGAADPEAVHAGVLEMVQREARVHDENSRRPAPIIEITLKGHLGFPNSLLELNRTRDEALEYTRALHVMVRNQTVPVEYAVAAGLDTETSRDERERRIVSDLVARDARYNDRAEEIAALIIETKQFALSDKSPAEILELIEKRIEADESEQAAVKEETPDDAEPDPTPTARRAIERSAV
jgi:DNA repair protein SbcD/Mre11